MMHDDGPMHADEPLMNRVHDDDEVQWLQATVEAYEAEHEAQLQEDLRPPSPVSLIDGRAVD